MGSGSINWHSINVEILRQANAMAARILKTLCLESRQRDRSCCAYYPGNGKKGPVPAG